MSAWKATATTVMMVALSGLVKAHGHFIRLALLAILGLVGMYLLHKLAQDYNKIRGGGSGGGGGATRPRIISALGMATRLLRSKRSDDSQKVSSESSIENLVSKFSSVLFFDPIGCARKFVCYSASKPVANLTQSENNLLLMFQEKTENIAFRKFQEAAEIGKTTKNMTICETKFKTCYLSSKQLFKFYNFMS